MSKVETKIVTATSSKIKEDTLKRHPVGIVGGTFNPVHIGHLVMADRVMQQLKLERVLFIPDAQPPHRDYKSTIAASERVAMLTKAIANHPGFELDLSEITRGGISYTYDTIVELKQRYPLNDYYLILGADMIDYLPTWYHINDLARLVTFVGVRRPGYVSKSDYSVIWVDAPELAISSSYIRQQVGMGCSIRYLVPPAVEAYIKQKGLYRD